MRPADLRDRDLEKDKLKHQISSSRNKVLNSIIYDYTIRFFFILFAGKFYDGYTQSHHGKVVYTPLIGAVMAVIRDGSLARYGVEHFVHYDAMKI